MSNSGIREQRLEELKKNLILRAFPLTFITNGIERATSLELHNLRRINHKIPQKHLPYESKFDPRNTEIFQRIENNIQILLKNPKRKAILQNYLIIKAKVSAKLIQQNSNPIGFECGKPKCGAYLY